jgi:hypothetical protein
VPRRDSLGTLCQRRGGNGRSCTPVALVSGWPASPRLSAISSDDAGAWLTWEDFVGHVTFSTSSATPVLS